MSAVYITVMLIFGFLPVRTWRYLKTLGHIFQRNVGLKQIAIPRSETLDLICLTFYRLCARRLYSNGSF